MILKGAANFLLLLMQDVSVVQYTLLKISLQSLHDYDVKLPDFIRISSFMEDLNTGQRLPFSFSKLQFDTRVL